MRMLTILLAACALCAVACASRETRRNADFEPAPADVRTDWELARERCSQCHNPDWVFDDMRNYPDRDVLELLVEDMASRPKSRIQDDEVLRIVNALDWHRTR